MVAVRYNRLLAGESFDNSNNEIFYRCLGGVFVFLDQFSDTLRREFLRRLVCRIFLCSENIFIFNGRDAYELILFYFVDVPDCSFLGCLCCVGDGGEYVAKLVGVDDFKSVEKFFVSRWAF